MYKVWDRGKHTFELQGSTKCTPLWHNTPLPELYKLSGFDGWALKGIHTVNHILSEGTLKTFDILREEFDLPANGSTSIFSCVM